jgi:nitrate/nitrite-specific signal transduction histidine kinase
VRALTSRVESELRSPNRLRGLGVFLPIGFLLMIELVRHYLIERRRPFEPGHLLLAAIEIIAVVGFATLVFDLIERTQRESEHRNRELVAANAVSTALREPHDLEGIVDAALNSVLEATGALVATIVMHDRGSRWSTGSKASGRLNPAVSPAPDAEREVVDVPLTTGTAVLGTLRLTFVVDSDHTEVLAHDTLQNIGQQLASTIQNVALITDLQRGMKEGHAFYDVLIRISNVNPLPETLGAVVDHATARLGADAAVLRLNDRTIRVLQADGELAGVPSDAESVICFCSDTTHEAKWHPAGVDCPVRTDPRFLASVSVQLRGPEGPLGDLWLGRIDEHPFDDGDSRFLATLSELISIAITNARMQEHERQTATMAERERIAREMHDGMAQVLGVTHLRLRSLEARLADADVSTARTELTDLADLCHEAYADVREAIVGLRELTRGDQSLIEGLREYVAKYSRQSGIDTSLECDVIGDITLTPRAELQLLRVVQEALTNVRKHSGAGRAWVVVTDEPAGLAFTVADDGHGFAADEPGREGIGLHSMRERMALVGGTLTVKSTPGQGTRVTALVPGVHGRVPVAAEVAGVRG